MNRNITGNVLHNKAGTYREPGAAGEVFAVADRFLCVDYPLFLAGQLRRA